MGHNIGLRILISGAGLVAFAASAIADVTISNSATQNMTCTSRVCTPTTATAVLNVKDLEALLASGSTEVTTSGNGVQAGSIRIAAKLSWSRTSELTLVAQKAVTIDEAVKAKGTGGLSVDSEVGGFSFGARGNLTFQNLSSPLKINGATYTLVSSVSALASAIAAKPSGAYALADNYDASQDGTYSAAPVSTIFTGFFDGLGNTISNLSINDPANDSYVGLFGESTATFSNIRLTNVSVIGGSGEKDGATEYVGGLAGCVCIGTISHSFVGGVVSGGSYAAVGGIAGVVSTGAIVESGSSAAVSVGAAGSAGSLVGLTSAAAIERSFATGSVSGSGLALGGLVGTINTDNVEHSHATGTVTATASGTYVGGLVGFNITGKIIDSSATGAVQCQSQSACGGLVGFQSIGYGNDPAIARSFATGDVTSAGASGGLVGFAETGMILDSYATGATTAPAAGGLVGENDNQQMYHSIVRSYSAGEVSGSAGSAGGLIGVDEYLSRIENAYWDTTTSGITNKGQGAGNVENDPGIRGLGNTRLQSRLPNGFNPKVWAESPGINGGLPYLLDNPPPK